MRKIHAFLQIDPLGRILGLRGFKVFGLFVNTVQIDPADRIHIAQQHLHHQAGAPVLHTELLGGQAAKGVYRDRPVTQCVTVPHDGGPDPGLASELERQAFDRRRRDACHRLDVVGRDAAQAVGKHLKRGLVAFALEAVAALQGGRAARGKGLDEIGGRVHHHRLAVLVAQECAVLLQKIGRVGVACEEGLVDQALVDQDLGHPEQQHHVFSRAHRNPLVGLGGAV